MANKGTIPESERDKSGVVRSRNPNERQPGFAPGDPVKMVVKETWVDGKTRLVNKEFTVDARHSTLGHWQYQLRIAPNGSLWDGGKWFPERDLSPG
ncbi:hypothetical protein K458DRAFT_431410 [Lentithecium fluviatile CBS 122367]|uniref:Uncharacterized protein n=1 Tax=Lentithecium fluviatile CBS 122367 TaxID=1168545 RepID=A0A6G1J1S9_9PLEO|nr:hypothetical protein K458DRAFT_431410 [Lentithecium fluviatile CBS 122367]